MPCIMRRCARWKLLSLMAVCLFVMKSLFKYIYYSNILSWMSIQNEVLNFKYFNKTFLWINIVYIAYQPHPKETRRTTDCLLSVRFPWGAVSKIHWGWDKMVNTALSNVFLWIITSFFIYILFWLVTGTNEDPILRNMYALPGLSDIIHCSLRRVSVVSIVYIVFI